MYSYFEKCRTVFRAKVTGLILFHFILSCRKKISFIGVHQSYSDIYLFY